MRVSRGMILVLCSLLLLAATSNVWGCPVCYGDSDAPIMKGAEMSVIFMAITTYVLIGGGVAMFIMLRRRALRLQQQSETV